MNNKNLSTTETKERKLFTVAILAIGLTLALYSMTLSYISSTLDYTAVRAEILSQSLENDLMLYTTKVKYNINNTDFTKDIFTFNRPKIVDNNITTIHIFQDSPDIIRETYNDLTQVGTGIGIYIVVLCIILYCLLSRTTKKKVMLGE